MKLQELRAVCRKNLSSAARGAYCADVIIAHKLNISRAELFYKNDEIPIDMCSGIFAMTAKRALGVPLSYVLHEAEFYGIVFKVGRGVLIPRPETELLVEAVLSHYGGREDLCFADWCTGSGCIGAALLALNSTWSGFGVDVSRSALKWARINVSRLGLEKRFALIKNSVPSLCGIKTNSLDFIVSNPPYIPECDISGLMSEVRDFEPELALNGGKEGISLYIEFFKAFPRLLKEGGLFFTEIAGDFQLEPLIRANEANDNNFVLIDKIKDYAGITRHLIWKKRD